jgi:cation:H+ antiporter
VLLTAAQSLFAVVLLLDLNLSLLGAAALWGLFTVQLAIPETRMAITGVYIALTPLMLFVSREQVGAAFQALFARPATRFETDHERAKPPQNRI